MKQSSPAFSRKKNYNFELKTMLQLQCWFRTLQRSWTPSWWAERKNHHQSQQMSREQNQPPTGQTPLHIKASSISIQLSSSMPERKSHYSNHSRETHKRWACLTRPTNVYYSHHTLLVLIGLRWQIASKINQLGNNLHPPLPCPAPFPPFLYGHLTLRLSKSA